MLAGLVRRAVEQGLAAAEPWLTRPADKVAALRHGIAAGAELWRRNAPVLRAIVENWQSDPRLSNLWLQQMQSFTDATITQISGDREAMAHLAGRDPEAVAGALTWLGERLYYLAACQVPPFDQEGAPIDTLLHIWVSTLYGETRVSTRFGAVGCSPVRPRHIVDRPSVARHQPTVAPANWSGGSNGCSGITRGQPAGLAPNSLVRESRPSVRTVSRHLAHLGLNRRRFLDPTGAVNRPRRIIARRPSHMVHLDLTKTGQIPTAAAGASTDAVAAASYTQRADATRARNGTVPSK